MRIVLSRETGERLATTRVFLADFAAYAGRRGAIAAIFVLVGALLEGVGLILIIPLLGIVFRSGATAGLLHRRLAAVFDLLSVHSAFGQLSLLLGAFVSLMIVRAIVISTRDVTLAELQIGFLEAQRSRITERLAAAGWDQIVRLRHARIAHLMSSDIQQVGTAAHFLLQCAIALVVLVIQCVLAFLLAPILALLVFGVLVIGGFALLPMLRRAREQGSLVTGANLSLLNTTMQFLGGLKLAMSQNLQGRFVTEFQETLHTLSRRQIDYIRRQTNGRLAVATLAALIGAMAVLVGFGLLHTAPSLLIILLLILGRMSGPVSQIQQGAQQFAYSLPAFEKLKELEKELAIIPIKAEVSHTAETVPAGSIIFDNVSFRHPGSSGGATNSTASEGVHNLDLTIESGEFIGITGQSGAGKTTFADLLVGLFPPQSGRISVGGIALDHAILAAWRETVSYVSQDPFLFHDTIRRNLSWASPSASEGDMLAALRLAGAEILVNQMDDGLDTIVGERGTLVSGGERQRIALARAILRRPRLLVLDEATSAIDIAGERDILENLLALQPRPTIVLIAHRAESLAQCQRVLHFAEGGIVPNAR
jgi:ATP-binding cassette subfamily C protein